MQVLHFSACLLLFQNMVKLSAKNEGDLVHFQNENILGAFIWRPRMIESCKIVKLVLFSPSVDFHLIRSKKKFSHDRIWTCTPTVAQVQMWHLAIVVLYQLSYVADVVSLELYQWEQYPSQGWKRFPRKPALCQLSIGQLGKEQTSLLLLIWIFQFISDSCSNLGDTFYIHILWRALYDLPNDLPNSAQNMWFLTKLIFIGNVDVVHCIRSPKSVQPRQDLNLHPHDIMQQASLNLHGALPTELRDWCCDLLTLSGRTLFCPITTSF